MVINAGLVSRLAINEIGLEWGYIIYILGDQKCSTLFNHDSLVMCKLDGNRGMPRMPQPLATCPNSLDNDGVNMFNMFS
jgi:hypothetical protein